MAKLSDTWWAAGLTHKDWMFDGRPIRGARDIERFGNLDWSKARIDLGPSVAGNLGPYWHVPLKGSDTIHRLYPRLLLTKWLKVARQACLDYAEWAPKYKRQERAFAKRYPAASRSTAEGGGDADQS